jgi:NAD(P)-dependent dehydrogenase (short-subunit alcohol dehydrogenase family)
VNSKTALITGSTSGIRRAAALLLARNGTRVIVSGRDVGRGREVTAQIRAEGGRGEFVGADLHDARSAAELAAGGSLDIPVNNATIGVGGPTEGFDESAFGGVLATNLKVPFYLVANIAPGMAARGGGAIVNGGRAAA